eukprot:388103_1
MSIIQRQSSRQISDVDHQSIHTSLVNDEHTKTIYINDEKYPEEEDEEPPIGSSTRKNKYSQLVINDVESDSVEYKLETIDIIKENKLHEKELFVSDDNEGRVQNIVACSVDNSLDVDVDATIQQPSTENVFVYTETSTPKTSRCSANDDQENQHMVTVSSLLSALNDMTNDNNINISEDNMQINTYKTKIIEYIKDIDSQLKEMTAEQFSTDLVKHCRNKKLKRPLIELYERGYVKMLLTKFQPQNKVVKNGLCSCSRCYHEVKIPRITITSNYLERQSFANK